MADNQTQPPDESPSAPFVTPVADARPAPCSDVIAAGLALALIAAAVWFVYGRALHAPFIFDDRNSVQTNLSITRLWPLFTVDGIPGPLNPPHDYCTAGRPVVNYSLALNYHYGRLNPAGYRAVNIVLHMLSAWLLWAILRRALALDFFVGRFQGDENALALVAAIVWAVHPLASEAVVYITQRTELLVSFFYLGTLYASLRYFTTSSTAARAAWIVVATVACLLGMGSKEVMVTAPVMVLLFERTFIAGSFRRALVNSWPLYVGLATGWMLLAALNFQNPRSGSAGFHLGLPAHLWWFTQAKVLVMYVKLAAWPWPLTIHYEIPYLQTVAAAWPWLTIAAVIAAGTLVLIWRRSAAGFAFAWVLAVLAPTLLVPIVTEVAVERRMYLPLAGLVALAVAAAYGLAQLAFGQSKTGAVRGEAPLRATVGVVAAVAIVLAMVTCVRLAAYQSALTLWQDAVDHNAEDYLAQNNLGYALMAAGRVEESILHYEDSARLKSDYTPAYINLGVAWTRLGRPQQACEPFETALALEPTNLEAHYNYAVALSALGQHDAAIAHLAEAVRLNSNFVEAQNNLGVALTSAGRPAEAISHFEQALRVQPTYVEAYASMAMAYGHLGRRAEALRYGDEALAMAQAQNKPDVARQISAWLEEYRQQQGRRD